MTAERLPIVGVMGSGSSEPALAEPLGAALAVLDVHLLTGGGRGAMAAVSRGFASVARRKGKIVGILPGVGDPPRPRDGYPNPWIEIPIQTHLPLSGDQGEDPLSRNAINVLTADALIALAGGPGTASEVRLAMRFGKPLAALVAARDQIPGLPDDAPLVETVEAAVDFVRRALEKASAERQSRISTRPPTRA